jgi:glycerate 2-kinase
MRIVVALDKFKDGITAPRGCELVGRAIHAVLPQAEIVIKPMADGGDGTAEALIAARSGEWIPLEVTGPLPEQRVQAGYGWFAADETAVVEMASASGLALLRESERNPWRATTFGTGELIAAAIKKGACRILLGVGGSATNDGGVGAAMALGWQFLDARGKRLGLGGGELLRLTTIVPPPHALRMVVEVLCDVDNPLCGEQGAARVYGPQKGATATMVEQLDAGLLRFAAVVRAQLGTDLLRVSGAGAAGGMAAGAMAFLGARLTPGIEAVMRVSRLEEALEGANWVITGEGRFDVQSLRGKVVAGVAAAAQRHGVRILVLAGAVCLPKQKWIESGIEEALAVSPVGMPLGVALARTEEFLYGRTVEWARTMLAQET